MFRPLAWSQNEKSSTEQKRVVELASRKSLCDSSTIPEEMGQNGLGIFAEPVRVQPISIASALRTPKLVKPVPIANKVLISFEDEEEASHSQEFSVRKLRNCPVSFSQASGLSSQTEDAALTFSSTPLNCASANKDGNNSFAYERVRNESKTSKRSDAKSEEFDEVPDYDESRKPEHDQPGSQDFYRRDISKVDTPTIRDAGDDLVHNKMLARRTSFFSPEDMENIPPASILTIESPASGYRSLSPSSMPVNSSQEDVTTFVTPPLHFRSFRDNGSSDSKASESLSSTTSSKGGDSATFPSFSSMKSSDDHPGRSRGSVSASSSSSFKSDDVTTSVHESTQKCDRRQRSREQKRVLRIFDRRQNSAESRDIMDNPWFQAMAIESEFGQFTGTVRPTSCPRNVEQKGKRAKMSKLGRSLKNQGKRKATESANDRDPKPHDTQSISTSLSSNTGIDPDSSSKDIASEQLRHVLRKALSGKRRLDDVLECMMRVYTRPSENVLQLLYKYFGSVKTVESAVKWITEELRVLQEDMPERKRTKEIEAYIVLSRIYREILFHMFTNGPGTVKKAFLSCGKARSALTQFFEMEVPQGRLELKSWAKTSVSIFRILNSLITDHPSDVVLYISSKEGLLRTIVSKHICFPEVVSFISKLCASDALSETSENHFRYGPPNPDGILLLAKENIIDTLAHVFIDSCDARSGNSSDLIFDMQRNSLQCLRDISFKAVTMPKFGKTNCTMNMKQIKMLNTALDSIALYSAADHMQAGIEYSLRRIAKGGGDQKVLSSLFERNYPLIRILSLSTDLLDAVFRASESRNFAVRRTIGMVSTRNLEDVLLSKLDDLCVLLESNSTSKTISTTRLSIIQLLRCMFGSDQNNVWISLSNKKVPELLLDVVEENEWCTLIHKAVIECLEASLKRKDAVLLHRQWISCLGRSHGWTTEMRHITGEKQSRGEEAARQRRSQIHCTYTQITSALVDIANSVYKTDLSSLFAIHGVTEPFLKKLEVEITKERKEQNVPCGGPKPEAQSVSVLACAEFLAARLNDVNAV